MFIALLLAVAPTGTAVDAERAFAADAQTMGQWRAFEKWAARDAVMFVPQPISAHEWLRGRENPPAAVEWKPAASLVSCDGLSAINTGPWANGAKGVTGYFTTVWQKQAAGWRWVMDHGDALSTPVTAAERPTVTHASCTGQPKPPPLVRTATEARGASADGTLTWHWTVAADGRRTFAAQMWDGGQYRPIIANQVAAE